MKRRMSAVVGWTILLVPLACVNAGCGDRKSEEQDKVAVAPAEQQPAPAPAPEMEPTAKPAPAQEPSTRPAAPQPAAPAAKPTTSPESRPERKPQPDPAETLKAKPEAQRPPAAAAPPDPKPAAPPGTTPQKPAAPESAKQAASDVVVLTGAPMGGVRLEHKLHAVRAGNTCTGCHHASRPEKPARAPQQACSDCHTKTATTPMKTKYQAAFHNPAAQSGTCIDCHKAQNAQGKKAPLKCPECHKKENA